MMFIFFEYEFRIGTFYVKRVIYASCYLYFLIGNLAQNVHNSKFSDAYHDSNVTNGRD